MGKQCCHFFSAVFDPIFLILAGNEDMNENSKFGQIGTPRAELGALDRLK